MVNKAYSSEQKNMPLPLDESWWQAILAEEETHLTPIQDKNGSSSPPSQTAPQNQEGVDWEKASELYEQDQTVLMKVTGFNRGGLLVSGAGLQGFVPISHLVDVHEEIPANDQSLRIYLDHTLRLKVIECDRARSRVVFSERAALAEPGKRNELLYSLKADSCVCGVVTNITDFGVFVDLGGVEGLVHVSEISWGRVQHPADVVQIDQRLEVYVIQVDRERGRVALSLKRMCPNPWETAEQRYNPGQQIEAIITSIVPYGAFARLETGLDGLIHISEMGSGQAISHPSQILHEGQKVQVRILHVDSMRQRLGLSMQLDDGSNVPAEGQAASIG